MVDASPRSALIVAHGSPADPGPQEAALQALAVRVAMWLPGWRVRGATLAAKGALEAALKGMDAPLIYPFFMAEGWFTRTNLPKRLDGVGRQLPAFGGDPGMVDLVVRVAVDGALAAGLVPAEAVLLIAAHGSQVSRASADGARALAEGVAARGAFGRVEVGFVEESPYLGDVAKGLGPAICLPFFALRAGHVAVDVPEALSAAGFGGVLLPAIGEHGEVARMIAAALATAHVVRA